MVLLGLGNPGRRYRWTRHNLGFHVLDVLAAKNDLQWQQGAAHERAEFDVEPTHLLLVKPNTYVNLSGEGLRGISSYCRIEPQELLVIADDIALPFGRLRLRRQGSHGGHNGLRSIIEELGTSQFARLRMGIGPVPPHVDPADFVLARLSGEDRERAEDLVRRAVSCIEDLLEQSFDRVMSLYNVVEPHNESD
ncbi:MAG: aminoacyl-tRNA hydrolase [Candidatus Krumholzibacteria bacterium]|nr:aminoacyl-tRNA hydrolase [Candidatus Krumholzibacteria bacterium]